MIQIREVDKQYGNKKVLEDVSFTLPENKMISFIGSNGAGKSTLLNIVARTLLRDKGDIIIKDKHMEAYKSNELAKILAILNQSNHLNVRLKVKELVSFGRFPYSKNNLIFVINIKIFKIIMYERCNFYYYFIYFLHVL